MSIDVTRDGAVATVEVNRPDRLNALGTSDLRELLSAFRDLGRDRSARTVIFTGAGDRAFIAGADISEMAGLTSDEALALARLGHEVAATIESLPQPVIAAVNGYAFGGGCELALAADIRIASSNAQFAQPEVMLGIPPGWGGSQRLPRVVGSGYAAEMILTGKRIGAGEALRIGLVNSVHETSELRRAALEIATQIAKNSPHAVRVSKKLMSAQQRWNPVAGLAEEARTFASSFDHPDQRNGMRAFLEKRPAEYRD